MADTILSTEETFFRAIEEVSQVPDTHEYVCFEGIKLNCSPTLDFSSAPFSGLSSKKVIVFRDCHFPFTTTVACPMTHPIASADKISERTIIFDKCKLGILRASGDTNIVLTQSPAAEVRVDLREQNVFVSSRCAFTALHLGGSMKGAGFVHTEATQLYLELENRHFRFWRRSSAGGGRFCVDTYPHQVWDPDFSLTVTGAILSSRPSNVAMFRDLCPGVKAIHLSRLGDFE